MNPTTRPLFCALVLWTLTALGAVVSPCFGINASPHPYVVAQPDGTPVTLRIRGDETLHWEQDPHGFTVIRNRGWYVFARRDAVTGHLVPTELRAGIDNPRAAGLTPGVVPSAAAQAERRRALGAPGNGPAAAGDPPAAAPTTTGTLKNLVVLIRWSDHGGRTLPAVTDIDVVMNHVGSHALAPTGSVRDVYLANSYGALTLDSTVSNWITSNNTETYYANGNSGLTSRTHDALRHALDVLDADPNFHFTDFDGDGDGQIDAITFLHSGYGAEWGGNDCSGQNYVNRMWSHKWSIFGGWTSSDGVTVRDYHISPAVWGTCGSNVGRIGVIAHETGHFLGLPDLYDTDNNGSGIGSYGLMANSWGFDGSQHYPPHMSPWSKVQLGWTTPTVISSAGTYNLPAAELSASVFRIDQGYPANEYLLIENRQPLGFDGDMPQGGLTIWHIDDNAGYNTQGYPGQAGWPSNGNHYRVALLQADGNYHLEKNTNRGDGGDVWHFLGVDEIGPSVVPSTGPFPNTDAYQGGTVTQTNNRIYAIGTSGSTMSFSYQVVGTPGLPPVAPSNLMATAASYDQIDLIWTDNATDEDLFTIDRSSDGVSFAFLDTVEANVTAYSDTGLSPDSTRWYRVRASNVAGDSEWSNVDSAMTNPPPPPPTPPSNLVATAVSDVQIDLSWTHTATDEDGFEIHRSLDQNSWTVVDTLSANSVSYADNNAGAGLQAQTLYYYQVFAFNNWGSSPSNTANAETQAAPSTVDHVADLDVFVSGTVTRTHTDTWTADEIEQIITERESGGRPSRRRSFLEHRWRFSDVRGGLAITLNVDASAPSNAENDNFAFEASRDAGSTWEPLLVVNQGTAAGTLRTAALPSPVGGTIYVRVVDTDDTQGNRSLDSIHVDHLYLQTNLDPDETPPAKPTGLTATAISASDVSLIWTDEADNELGYHIQRSDDGVTFQRKGDAPIDAQAFVDSNGVAPNTTYHYKVVAFTASFETESDVVIATTPEGISLSATGAKKKGAASATLTWIGGSSLDTMVISRSTDGGEFVTIASNVPNAGGGSYIDDTGLKGQHTLTYKVCSPDESICSNEVTLNF